MFGSNKKQGEFEKQVEVTFTEFNQAMQDNFTKLYNDLVRYVDEKTIPIPQNNPKEKEMQDQVDKLKIELEQIKGVVIAAKELAEQANERIDRLKELVKAHLQAEGDIAKRITKQKEE